MNITSDKLAAQIINQIMNDLGEMERSGAVKFSLTKTEKRQVASDWFEMIKHKISDSMVKSKSYTAGFDGSATPNPGDMKIGGWIKNPSGKRIYDFTKAIGHGTNNEAEYNALIKLMSEIKKRGIIKVKIKGDSALVVNQVNSIWKTKDPRMKKLRHRVLSESKGLDYILEHVVREYNSEADLLTR